MTLLDEIRDNWKLEAKSEKSLRYFFHLKEVASIENGTKAYVIGRKGTGKTAIAEYLANISDSNVFSEKLSFKNFPFNDLYSLKNDGYTRPNQYITFWKYIIYSFICKMMAKNAAIEGEIAERLRELYAPEPVSYLKRLIGKWTATDFNLSILGTGGSLKGSIVKTENDWINRVEILEDIIAQNMDQSKYFILFDELDEDYKNIADKDQYKNYTDLLTGLFKAVQDIKAIFKRDEFKIFPIIFLRDDIYSILTDPDKTKWDDYKIDLEWDKKRIKELLAFRISRAINENEGKVLNFEAAWNKLFINMPISMGNRQVHEMSIFDYIVRSTHLRPRDFIRYIHDCASNTDPKYHKISPRTVKQVDKAFSSYLKRELIDEIHGVIPEIDSIFEVLSQIRKQTFSLSEFRLAYDVKLNQGSLSEKNIEWILKILFLFSVIGNQPRQVNQTVFRYINKDSELNFKESFVVHRGLLKALQIM